MQSDNVFLYESHGDALVAYAAAVLWSWVRIPVRIKCLYILHKFYVFTNKNMIPSVNLALIIQSLFSLKLDGVVYK